MYVFGSGALIGQASGGSPINFGLVQEVSLDIGATLKELYGQNDYPVAIGSGTKKLTGKAKMAKISGVALASLFFGYTPSTGQTLTQFGEAATIPSTPYQVTVTNAATFVADMGVVYATTGMPLKQVPSAPTTGQYTVNAATGVYTFVTGDSAKGVLISYTYTSNAATSQKFTVSTKLIGPTVNFSANLFANDPTTGNQWSVYLYNCVAAKLSFGTKLEDFMIPEMDFSCYANAAGKVIDFNFGDAA